jgi:hypothetical protein
VKQELSFLLSLMTLLMKTYSKYHVNRASTFKVLGNIKFHVKVASERGKNSELSFLLSRIALFMLMIYSKYEVNRTSTFKFICNIKFHVKAGDYWMPPMTLMPPPDYRIPLCLNAITGDTKRGITVKCHLDLRASSPSKSCCYKQYNLEVHEEILRNSKATVNIKFSWQTDKAIYMYRIFFGRPQDHKDIFVT